MVIKTIPHAKKKVAPGSTVTISYLTESVIKESQKLFDEQEKQKHIKEQNRLEKSAKSKEKRAESFYHSGRAQFQYLPHQYQLE